MELTIIIPTFNEKENIGILLDRIFQLSKKVKIIIVDDSPNQDIKKVTNRYNDIYYIHRSEKRGRGSAVLKGISFALEKFNSNYIIEMDADLSHDTKEIIKNVNFFLEEKADLLISSRYLKNSKILNWPIKRKILSFLANNLARFILRVPVSDYTNGFRFYSKRAAKTIISKCNKTGGGFIILSEIILILWKNNYKISEIKSIFKNRTRGESSVNLKLILESLLGLFKLYLIKKSSKI